MESRHRRSTFTLRLFEEDYINIASLVSKVPNEETGGNLFGLWTNCRNAVVLVATGPGENCSRTAVSFYQDIPYMERVGHLLTNQYPLCHIGEWHSHHQLQLFEPSGGDSSTIRRNYPRGSQGFVLMIANIINDGKVTLSPYKFVDELSEFQVGKIEVWHTKNPFNEVDIIKSAINKGRETAIRQQQSQLPYLESRDLVERSRQRGNQPDDYRSRSRSRSPIKKHASSSPKRSPEREHRQNNTVINQSSATHIPRPPSPKESDIRRPTFSRASGIRYTSPNRTRERTNRGQESSTDHDNKRHDRTGRSEGEGKQVTSTITPWYELHPSILKQTLSFIQELSGDYNIVIKRDKSTKELSFEFKHYCYQWTVQFPNNFPNSGTITLRKDESVVPKVLFIYPQGLGKFMEDFKARFQRSCTCRACCSFKGQNPWSRY